MKYLFDVNYDDIRLNGINHELFCRKGGQWHYGNATVYLLGTKVFVKDGTQYNALIVNEADESIIPDALQSKLYTMEEMEVNGYTEYVALTE